MHVGIWEFICLFIQALQCIFHPSAFNHSTLPDSTAVILDEYKISRAKLIDIPTISESYTGTLQTAMNFFREILKDDNNKIDNNITMMTI